MRKIYLIILLLHVAFCVSAQKRVHDSENYAIIMGAELGGQPSYLITKILHNGYTKSVKTTGRTTLREPTVEAAAPQVENSDTIKKKLESRAFEEGKDATERKLNVAWETEKKRVEAAMMRFQTAISHIAPYGGTAEEQAVWEETYNAYQQAVGFMRDDKYLPNAERKKEFVALCDDITTSHEALNARLLKLIRLKQLEKFKNTTPLQRLDTKKSRIDGAYNHWREAAAVAYSNITSQNTQK